MQAFLEYIVKALVDRPDAVALTKVARNNMTVFELRVHPTDMGKIIGRQGATVNAIRSLLLVGSAKQGLRCSLEVIDEEGDRDRDRDRRDNGGYSTGEDAFRSQSENRSTEPTDSREGYSSGDRY